MAPIYLGTSHNIDWGNHRLGDGKGDKKCIVIPLRYITGNCDMCPTIAFPKTILFPSPSSQQKLKMKMMS